MNFLNTGALKGVTEDEARQMPSVTSVPPSKPYFLCSQWCKKVSQSREDTGNVTQTWGQFPAVCVDRTRYLTSLGLVPHMLNPPNNMHSSVIVGETTYLNCSGKCLAGRFLIMKFIFMALIINIIKNSSSHDYKRKWLRATVLRRMFSPWGK